MVNLPSGKVLPTKQTIQYHAFLQMAIKNHETGFFKEGTITLGELSLKKAKSEASSFQCSISRLHVQASCRSLASFPNSPGLLMIDGSRGALCFSAHFFKSRRTFSGM
jgi:hypothetical protein